MRNDTLVQIFTVILLVILLNLIIVQPASTDGSDTTDASNRQLAFTLIGDNKVNAAEHCQNCGELIR